MKAAYSPQVRRWKLAVTEAETDRSLLWWSFIHLHSLLITVNSWEAHNCRITPDATKNSSASIAVDNEILAERVCFVWVFFFAPSVSALRMRRWRTKGKDGCFEAQGKAHEGTVDGRACSVQDTQTSALQRWSSTSRKRCMTGTIKLTKDKYIVPARIFI